MDEEQVEEKYDCGEEIIGEIGKENFPVSRKRVHSVVGKLLEWGRITPDRVLALANNEPSRLVEVGQHHFIIRDRPATEFSDGGRNVEFVGPREASLVEEFGAVPDNTPNEDEESAAIAEELDELEAAVATRGDAPSNHSSKTPTIDGEPVPDPLGLFDDDNSAD